MNRNKKIGLSVLIIAAVTVSITLPIVFLLPPAPTNGDGDNGDDDDDQPNGPDDYTPQEINPNTYVENNTITHFGYAIQFLNQTVVIEDNINILNGSVSGWPTENSTVLKDSTIIDNNTMISFALYGNTSLILKNIWNQYISIILNDETNLLVENCTLGEIDIIGAVNINIINSTIQTLISTSTAASSQLTIQDNSYINMAVFTSFGGQIYFSNSEFSQFLCYMVNPYSYQNDTYLIEGEIINCSIYMLYSYKYTKLTIYNSDIYQGYLMGNTQFDFRNSTISEISVAQSGHLILNNTNITQTLKYGIIITSNTVNISNGIIDGTNYLNTTENIDGNINQQRLEYIALINDAKTYISNYSCYIFLYDSSILTINDSQNESNEDYYVILQDSSTLYGSNASFQGLVSFKDASFQVENKSFISSLLINGSGIQYINDTIIETCFCLEGLATDQVGEFYNCSINSLYVYPERKTKLIDCTINTLYDGIKFESGAFTLNLSGVHGIGTYSNELEIINCNINLQEYKYIVINDGVSINLNDLHNDIGVIGNDGTINMKNCTFSGITLFNTVDLYMNNCSFPSMGGFVISLISILGSGMITLFDNSTLHINDTSIKESMAMINAYEYSEIYVTYSELVGLTINNEAVGHVENSELSIIRVLASNPRGYSVISIDSIVENFLTGSWAFSM